MTKHSTCQSSSDVETDENAVAEQKSSHVASSGTCVMLDMVQLKVTTGDTITPRDEYSDSEYRNDVRESPRIK